LLQSGDRLLQAGISRGRKQFEQALPVFREIGDRHRTRNTLERIGNSFYEQGKRWSQGYYEPSVAIDLDHGPERYASDYGNWLTRSMARRSKRLSKDARTSSIRFEQTATGAASRHTGNIGGCW